MPDEGGGRGCDQPPNGIIKPFCFLRRRSVSCFHFGGGEGGGREGKVSDGRRGEIRVVIWVWEARQDHTDRCRRTRAAMLVGGV